MDDKKSAAWLAFASLHDILWNIEFGLQRTIAACDLIKGRLRKSDEVDYYSGNPPESAIQIRLADPQPYHDSLEHGLRTAIELMRDQDIPGHWEALAQAKAALDSVPEGMQAELNEIAKCRWVNHTRRLLNDLSERYRYRGFLEVREAQTGFPSTVSDALYICKSGESIDGWLDSLNEIRTRLSELKACRPAPVSLDSGNNGKSAEKSDQDAKPRWDPDSGRLIYKGEVAREVGGQAPNLRTVLAALEEQGWPPRIDDPLPGGKNQTRLNETIRTLYDGLSHIRFRGDGSGSGYRWEAVDVE